MSEILNIDSVQAISCDEFIGRRNLLNKGAQYVQYKILFYHEYLFGENLHLHESFTSG